MSDELNFLSQIAELKKEAFAAKQIAEKDFVTQLADLREEALAAKQTRILKEQAQKDKEIKAIADFETFFSTPYKKQKKVKRVEATRMPMEAPFILEEEVIVEPEPAQDEPQDKLVKFLSNFKSTQSDLHEEEDNILMRRIDNLERLVSAKTTQGVLASSGGGETRFLKLDDVDTTDLVNNTVPKYDSASSKFIFSALGSGAGHTIQKNDLQDAGDSTTTLGDKTNLLFDEDVFRVSNDSGTDSTQVRLVSDFTGITRGTATANKAVILGASKVLDGIGNITNASQFSGTTITGTQLVSSGTGAASINTSGGITISGQILGATTVNANDIDVQDTNSEAVIQLHRNETGSNGNAVGKVKFKGNNSAGSETNFAQIGGKQKTITDTSEDGEMEFNVMNAGTMQTSLSMDEDGIDIPGSRTIKFGGADAFRIMTTQPTTGQHVLVASYSDGRIKVEIDGSEYYIAIWDV
jgi:hypothetical protein